MSDIKIKKKLSPQKLSEKYFELVGCMNNIPITPAEAQLLGYIAVNGFPRTREQKQKYFQECERSEPTLNNLIHFLKKKNLLVSRKRQTNLHPALTVPNPHESLTLNIVIENE